MFSVDQKKQIAEAVEKTLLSFNHPEVPTEKPSFKLHVDGKESWSFADIEPNWIYNDNNKPGLTLFNEIQAAQKKEEAPETIDNKERLPFPCNECYLAEGCPFDKIKNVGCWRFKTATVS